MILILWLLAALAVANGHKKTCQKECELNYIGFSFQVATLVPECYRGCDMYQVAFISTSLNPYSQELTNQISNSAVTPQSRNGNQLETNSIISPKELSETTENSNCFRKMYNDIKKFFMREITNNLPNISDKVSENPQVSVNSIEAMEGKQKIELTGNASNERKQKISQKMKMEGAKRTCRHACRIAYEKVSQVEACVVGCNFQSKTDHIQEQAENPVNSFTSPLRTIKSSILKLAGNIGHFIRVSWSWSLPKSNKEEPGKVQEYGTQNAINPTEDRVNLKPAFSRDQLQRTNVIRPEVKHVLQAFGNNFILDPALFKNIDHSMNDITDQKHNLFNIKAEQFKSHQGDFHKHEKTHHYEATDHFQQKIHHEKMAHQNDVRKGPQFRQPHWLKSPEVKQSLDILECISRKSGLPRWFIAVTMFSSIPVALWLCFSLTASSDDTKNSKTKVVDVKNGLDFDDITNEKSKLMEDYDDCVKPAFETV